MRDLVSIIIPCYNAEKYIFESVNSALNQTYGSCEIIVLDDGSTDDSVEILGSFGSKIILSTGSNRGACHCRNKGIEIASGKFIKFLDADDFLLPEAIAQQMQTIQQLPPDTICYGDTLDYDSNEAVFGRLRLSQKLSTDETVAALIGGDIITSSPLHRRGNILKVQGFNSALKRGQEWNFHIRLALSGVKFHYEPTAVYRYRQHDSPDRISNHNSVLSADFSRLLITSAEIEANYEGRLPESVEQSLYKRLRAFSWYLMNIIDKKTLIRTIEIAERYNRPTTSIDCFVTKLLIGLLGFKNGYVARLELKKISRWFRYYFSRKTR